MTLPLSVLDLAPVSAGHSAAQALHNTLELSRAAEGWGYMRYWLAEHHNLPAMACPSPEIMIGQVAAVTSRMRVGSGGIMLPNHSALRIAEAFKVLEALFPGRIDLGIGRAAGTDPRTAYALRRAGQSVEEFPQQLAELNAFANGGFPDDHPFRAVVAEPRDVALPPIWILGSSDYGAQLAASLGMGFAFARHMNPRGAEEIMHLYRERFRPSANLSEPWCILALSAICADTPARAEQLVASMGLAVINMRSGRSSPLPSPEDSAAYPYNEAEADQIRRYRRAQVVGDRAAVREEIADLAQRTQADEVMVMSMVYHHDERLRSYELIASEGESVASVPPLCDERSSR